MEGAAAAAATATEVPSTVVVADGKFFHELHAELSSKMQRFGKPKASHILGMLQKLTPDTRKNFGWEGEEISLHNPDHGVREIERTFRKLGWDFNHAKVVPGSRPPDFDLFLMMTKDLARYFDEHPVALKSPGSDAKLAENNAWAAKSTASTASSANSDSGNDTERCSGGGSNRRASKKQEIKYWVKGSKKGSFRITKERRKRGKFVTVVANVGGDVQLMLKELRGALGTGGTYNAENNCLEMQGDCAAAVEKWLVHQQCLVGVTAKIKASITKDEDRKKAKEDAKKAKANAVRQTQLERRRREKQIDISRPPTSKELNTMKPDQLKAHLKARDLSTQGSKKELLSRLTDFLSQQERQEKQDQGADAASAGQSTDQVAAIAGAWTASQQQQLEETIVNVQSADPKERWKLISARVDGKSAKECFARSKVLRQSLAASE